MPAEKSLAIVLRLVDFSETSCVVTMYTREFGKSGALAKGARRPKSPFESALDLLSVCRIVFIRKSSGSLDLLTEAKLERRFRSATRNLSRLYAGYYVAELLDLLTDVGDPLPQLYDIADQALAAIDSDAELAPSVLSFELSALRLLGHIPSLIDCVECGKRVETTARVAFSQIAGGVFCSTCRIGKRRVVSVSGPTIDTLRTFASEDDSEWHQTAVGKSSHGELRGVLNNYMNYILGTKPRLQSYLGVLGNDENVPANPR